MLKKLNLIISIFFVAGYMLLVPGCKKIEEIITPETESPNAVFIQTNQVSGNSVRMYARTSDGVISFLNSYSTQGNGTGTLLGSQGSMEFNEGRSYMFVVNAGTNDITSFAVNPTGLVFVNRIEAGGIMPVSVTVKGDLLYVLNAGGSGNINAFRIGNNGALSMIASSLRNLSNNGSGASPGPAQIAFNQSGSLLVVTEKITNKIVSYTVNGDGTAAGPNVFPSAGKTPFGFEFRNDNTIIVSEAFNGLPDSSTVSSYSINSSGTISLISGPVRTTETAACWVVITNNGQFTYASNTGSGTITGLGISGNGQLTMLNPDGVTANIGAGTMPIDMALTVNSQFLYCLNSGNHTISTFSVAVNNGALTVVNLSAITGLPSSSVGILAK
jgi:6-phosphogluconolactonase (cycloisomerase 2 family)